MATSQNSNDAFLFPEKQMKCDETLNYLAQGQASPFDGAEVKHKND